MKLSAALNLFDFRRGRYGDGASVRFKQNAFIRRRINEQTAVRRGAVADIAVYITEQEFSVKRIYGFGVISKLWGDFSKF